MGLLKLLAATAMTPLYREAPIGRAAFAIVATTSRWIRYGVFRPRGRSSAACCITEANSAMVDRMGACRRNGVAADVITQRVGELLYIERVLSNQPGLRVIHGPRIQIRPDADPSAIGMDLETSSAAH